MKNIKSHFYIQPPLFSPKNKKPINPICIPTTASTLTLETFHNNIPETSQPLPQTYFNIEESLSARDREKPRAKA